MREPMRSAKRANWARVRSLISAPFHALRTSRSWLADSAWMRSEKRSTKSSGFCVAVCWAIECTTLSIFFGAMIDFAHKKGRV